MQGGHAIEGPGIRLDYVWLVEAPRVALITGDETSSLGSGEVWWHFERELEYPITIECSGVFTVGMGDFDVVVLPSGWYGSASESWMEELSGWVRDGGRAIALSWLSTYSPENPDGIGALQRQRLEQTVRARSSEERIANCEKPTLSGNGIGHAHRRLLFHLCSRTGPQPPVGGNSPTGPTSYSPAPQQPVR